MAPPGPSVDEREKQLRERERERSRYGSFLKTEEKLN